MKKLSALLPLLLIFTLPCLGYDGDYDDDSISVTDSFYMALVGGGFMLVGSIISQIKFLSGLGKFVFGLGGVVAFLGVAGIAISIISTVVNAAFKAALYIGAILAVIFVIRWIFLQLAGNKSE
jgi:hypothetical protein